MGGYIPPRRKPSPPPAPAPAPKPKPKPVVAGPTEVEVSQSSAADAAIQTKKRGRYSTIATSREGVLGQAQTAKKTLLG